METKYTRKPDLKSVWQQRLELRADGNKLIKEGERLCAEGDMLKEKGNKLWAEAVIAAYGHILMEWIPSGKGYDCKLENGEIYKYEEL